MAPALDGSMDAAMSSDSGKDVGPLTDELLRAELRRGLSLSSCSGRKKGEMNEREGARR